MVSTAVIFISRPFLPYVMQILAGRQQRKLTAKDAKENQGEICIDMRTQYRPVQAYGVALCSQSCF
jgi:hypothetical protein